MNSLENKLDNSDGKPIFQPELTGISLNKNDLADWKHFCLQVFLNDESGYNTFFESRWCRANEKIGGGGLGRGKSTVRAFRDGDDVIIQCPTKIWARLLSESMSKYDKFKQIEYIIRGPHEYEP